MSNTIEDGEAWIWSPHFLKKTVRTRFRMRHTYDSGATPKALAARPPATLADVDLEAVKAKMAQTIERAKAEDPRELRRRVAELERQLRERQAAKPERVEVPVLADRQIARFEKAVGAFDKACVRSAEAADRVRGANHQFFQRVRSFESTANAPEESMVDEIKRNGRWLAKARGEQFVASARRQLRILTPSGGSIEPRIAEAQLKAGERRMLEVMARHHELLVTRSQLGTLSGFTPKGGTFGQYFGTLKRTGLLEESNGHVSITKAGLKCLGLTEPPPPQTTEETLERWYSALRSGEKRMLQYLVGTYPRGVSREELGRQTGFTHDGGTFGQYLGTLRRNGLVACLADLVVASETLFVGEAR